MSLKTRVLMQLAPPGGDTCKAPLAPQIKVIANIPPTGTESSYLQATHHVSSDHQNKITDGSLKPTVSSRRALQRLELNYQLAQYRQAMIELVRLAREIDPAFPTPVSPCLKPLRIPGTVSPIDLGESADYFSVARRRKKESGGERRRAVG
jgi:hypothetical protein